MPADLQFLLFGFASVFTILGVPMAVPVFLAITPTNTREERVRMARMACVVAFVVLGLFSLVGEWVFTLLGVTLPAFQVAGGIVLLSISLNMLKAEESPQKITREEKEVARDKEDVAVTPMGVPILAGPGGISTVVLLQGQAEGLTQHVLAYLAIALAVGATYAVLHVASRGAGWINPLVLRVASRLMGLLLAALAVQFVFNGLTSSGLLAGLRD